MIKELVQTVYNNRLVKDKNGVERKQRIYFLVLENGKRIPIKPVFNEDYEKFDMLARIEFNDSPRKEVK